MDICLAQRLENFDLAGISHLESAKNLLGFSAQVDSTCLFFVLLEIGIEFDIAIVDYQTRADSTLEIKYAKDLATKYNKKIFVIESPRFENNFEANARAFRMDFFKNLIQSHNYKNLILANHLNDRLEWFFMQFAKGGALHSLLGFDAISKYSDFNIIRPFFNTPKRQILDFLQTNNIKYFIDKSNDDEAHLRNYFRINFTNLLMEHYENGIKKSLNLLKNEYKILYKQSKIQSLNERLYFFAKQENHINLHNIALCAKKLGYVLSSKQREEIIKSNYSCVIASKIVIDNNFFDIYVAKNDIQYKHSKKIRESFRKKGIPPRIRPLIENIL